MKKILIKIFLLSFIVFISCSKTYIIYCKNNRVFYTKQYSYDRPGDRITPLDVDSVRLLGDTTHTEYKYK